MAMATSAPNAPKIAPTMTPIEEEAEEGESEFESGEVVLVVEDKEQVQVETVMPLEM